MKTDTLFHEYFQTAPQALFELLQMTPGCVYRFESPVVKASERRLDGVLEPVEPGYPRYFLELQGYEDKSIYWRTIHELGVYHEQRPKLNGSEWRAIILFLDAVFDPGPETLGPLFHGTMPWLIRGVIPDLLQKILHPSPVLNVLRPLIAQDEQEVRQQSAQWVVTIQQIPHLDPGGQQKLLDLLVQFILQKFNWIDRKELGRMLQLRPLEESKAYQEWVQEAQATLLAEQIEQKFSISATQVMNRLADLDSKALKALGRYLMMAERYEQIEGWIDGRLALVE